MVDFIDEFPVSEPMVTLPPNTPTPYLLSTTNQFPVQPPETPRMSMSLGQLCFDYASYLLLNVSVVILGGILNGIFLATETISLLAKIRFT
jgi:hypothetical protein